LASKGSFVVAVGDNGTIVSSEDAGRIWKAQTSNSAARLVDVDIINPVIAVGDGGEVLLSTSQASGGPPAPGASYWLLTQAEAYQREEVEVPFGGEWLLVLGLVGQVLRWMRAAAIDLPRRTLHLCDLLRANGSRLRFGFLFAAILALMMVAFPWVEDEVTRWYLQPMSAATAAVLNTAGIDTRLDVGSAALNSCLLTMPRATFRIILECTGVFSAFILLAAMLATPSGWGRKLKGVLAVFPACFAYGALRLVVLGVIGYHLPHAIQFFHLWLMVLANLAFVLIFWHYWSREVPSHA